MRKFFFIMILSLFILSGCSLFGTPSENAPTKSGSDLPQDAPDSEDQIGDNGDDDGDSENDNGDNREQESVRYKDIIRLDFPLPEDKVSSPLIVRGEARGTWFFEATFPVVLTNWDGLIIAQGYAQADGNWMTEDYVPFTAELTFEKPSVYDRGSLILQKSNASGLPEYDDAFEITIYFE
ncbi:MAG TPA: Gmad2 immunoglobulin-like domain-containing protein [Patescibacteria group bacterium]|nr:Gmad2 immunoglobulin-like domain-containing protein [Patescibacteria group bacterium]